MRRLIPLLLGVALVAGCAAREPVTKYSVTLSRPPGGRGTWVASFNAPGWKPIVCVSAYGLTAWRIDGRGVAWHITWPWAWLL